MSRLAKAIVAASVIAVMAVAGPALAQKKKGEVHLVLANGYGKKIPMNHMFHWLIAPRLERYSGGRITTDVQTQGKLCSEHKCIEQVKLGQIDIGSSSAGNMGAFGPTFDVTFLPYLWLTDTAAQNAYNGWLGKILKEKSAKEQGLHNLGVFVTGGFRQLENTVREVRVPKDLKGIKIRVTKSPVEFSLIKAWGAIPVPYDWGQLYEGLQAGVVQGMYIPHVYTALRKFHEVTPYITETGGNLPVLVLSMKKDRFDKLPKWAQDVIDKVFAEMKQENLAIDRLAREQAIEILKTGAKVYTPTKDELAQWFSAAPEAWKKVKGRFDPAIPRRALKDQGNTKLLKMLEKIGAL